MAQKKRVAQHTVSTTEHLIVILALVITTLTGFLIASILARGIGRGLGYFAMVHEASKVQGIHAQIASESVATDAVINAETLLKSSGRISLSIHESSAPESDQEEKFRVSSFLYRTGHWVYIEVDGRRELTTSRTPWELLLSIAYVHSFDFGPNGFDGKFIDFIEIPSESLQESQGGHRLTLKLDLSTLDDLTIWHSSAAVREFTHDAHIFPSSIIDMTWEIGDENEELLKTGGRIRSQYDRPDGGRSVSIDTIENRTAVSYGAVLGSASHSFFRNTSEYMQETHDVSRSPEDLIPPKVTFPPDPDLPPEP